MKLRNSTQLLLLNLWFTAYILLVLPEQVSADQRKRYVTEDCVSSCKPGCFDRCNKVELTQTAEPDDPSALLMLCQIASPRNASNDKCICHDYPHYYHHIPICNEEPWSESGAPSWRIVSPGPVVLLWTTVIYMNY